MPKKPHPTPPLEEAAIILGGLLHDLDETACPQTFTEELRDNFRDQAEDALVTLESFTPPKRKPGKLVILVSGGVVQSVIATDKTVDVTVLDCDGDHRDANEARWEALCANRRYHAVH